MGEWLEEKVLRSFVYVFLILSDVVQLESNFLRSVECTGGLGWAGHLSKTLAVK